MDLKLTGKTAIITGGSRGLGEAICKRFAEEGANVVLTYQSNKEKAQKTADALVQQYGIKALAIKCEISDEEAVKALFMAAVKLTGTIDILVNNAGICPVVMIKETSYDTWKQVMETNLNGVFLTCRELVNYAVKKRKPANIVNIASQAAYTGSKRGKTHYVASKGGVMSFTISLAKETAKDGIRVNAVAPGMMYTDMTSEVLDAEIEKYNNQIPIGRIAKVEEVANVVAFMAGDVSSYMTGEIVDVSGGISAR